MLLGWVEANIPRYRSDGEKGRVATFGGVHLDGAESWPDAVLALAVLAYTRATGHGRKDGNLDPDRVSKNCARLAFS